MDNGREQVTEIPAGDVTLFQALQLFAWRADGDPRCPEDVYSRISDATFDKLARHGLISWGRVEFGALVPSDLGRSLLERFGGAP